MSERLKNVSTNVSLACSLFLLVYCIWGNKGLVKILDNNDEIEIIIPKKQTDAFEYGVGDTPALFEAFAKTDEVQKMIESNGDQDMEVLFVKDADTTKINLNEPKLAL